MKVQGLEFRKIQGFAKSITGKRIFEYSLQKNNSWPR
jgi:hypothetical protein